MKSLVLLSGGLDSATALAWALQYGECEAIGFDYGQPHSIELSHAYRVAEHFGVAFSMRAMPVLPKVNDVVFAGRNLVFAALAIAEAQAGGFRSIVVGCNASDWARFPDCRPVFWRSLSAAAEAYDVQVSTPLLHMPKRQVVEEARKLGVPIELTWSCYSPRNNEPCGECLACTTRQEALS